MNRYFFILLFSVFVSTTFAQEEKSFHDRIRSDFNQLLQDLSDHYSYLENKKVDLECIRQRYEANIPNLETNEDVVLFFEFLLDEFYDSHLILNTNTSSSFRLYSPIYARVDEDKATIANVWQTQIESDMPNLFGAEIVKINGKSIADAIESFPTICSDKDNSVVREWILNKVLAGRYNEPRLLTLRFSGGEEVEFNLDSIQLKQPSSIVSSEVQQDIGIIRINNSLGNNETINTFDAILEKMEDTKGIILDLRNTVDGGNSYVARGIMGRFIEEEKPYQKHETVERYDNAPKIRRSWVEYVSPRGEAYTKPLVVLVGRWTGSMGEGIAIGFDAMNRGTIIGTEMERLAGEIDYFPFQHRKYGYRLSTAKLYHINGTLRESFIPEVYVHQTTIAKDEVLQKALSEIKKTPQD
ncbi:S41 family peptidase [Luteirhabdus pelagi]|uniref:S41 family peptidase n=1 Tax=Luteirhabdus pelagi TaxID=2792783 RepID=UPI00193AA6FB|nr:S41 family peptidase [Luteirhabdus pelagi]